MRFLFRLTAIGCVVLYFFRPLAECLQVGGGEFFIAEEGDAVGSVAKQGV